MLVDGTFLFVFVAALLAASGRAFRLEDEGVTVALSPDVQQDKAADLLKDLKDQFQNASSVLCNATNGRFSFSTVRVILPKNWDTAEIKGFEKENIPWGKISSPDILVGTGSKNDVQQTRGCGQLGDFITLSADDISKKDKHFDRLLATLLVRWRFGVFPEEASGFHYHPHQQKVIPNSCTNMPLIWTSTPECVPNITNNCEIKIEDKDNVNVTSSLLYNYNLTNMHLFCNKTNHNHFAPTPQNLLCNGRSIWEIMELSEEPSKSNETDTKENSKLCPPAIEVKLVSQNVKNIYILLALDNLNETADAIAAAVTVAVQTVMVPGDHLSIFIGNTTVVEFNNNTEDTSDLAALIVEKTQDAVTNCLLCSLEEFKKEIDNATSSIAFIITDADKLSNSIEPTVKTIETRNTEKLTTTKPSDATQSSNSQKSAEIDKSIKEIEAKERDEKKKNEEQFEKLIEEFKSLPITVNTLAIGNTTVTQLEALANATGGHSYYIQDGNTLTEPVLLKSLINNLKENPVETIFSGAISENEPVKHETFYIDGSFQEVFAIISRSANKERVGLVSFIDEFNMTSGNCRKLSDNLTSVICNIKNPKPSWWWLMFEIPQPQKGFQQSIDIFGIPKNPSTGISASAWFNDNSPKVNLSEDTLTVFAKVNDGQKPYLNATVIATFSDGVNSTFELNLQDDGTGPDVFKDDGIYTGYVQNCPNTGRYSAQVKIKGKCYKNNKCMNEEKDEPIFERDLMVGSVVFTNCTNNIQKLFTSFPVRDLRVLRQSEKNVTLTWTHSMITHIQDAKYELRSLGSWSTNVTKWKTEGKILSNITNDDYVHEETVLLTSEETVVYAALIVSYKNDYFVISNVLALETKFEATTVSTTITSPSEPTKKTDVTGEITSDGTGTKETTNTHLASDTTGGSSSTNAETASTPETVVSPQESEVSGSSNSAAAGIIAVVIILSLAAVAGLSYYFVYYRRRNHNNSSPSVGYSNLE